MPGLDPGIHSPAPSRRARRVRNGSPGQAGDDDGLQRRSCLFRQRAVLLQHLAREIERAADQDARRLLVALLVARASRAPSLTSAKGRAGTSASMAISASVSGSKPASLPGTGTVIAWRTSPAKGRKKPAGSLVVSSAADEDRAGAGRGPRSPRRPARSPRRRRDCGRRRARCRSPPAPASTSGAGAQPLHARRPVGVRRARPRSRCAGSVMPAARKRRDREPGILHLVRAGKPRQRQVEQAVLVLVDEPPALGEGHVFAAVAEERRAGRLRLDLDHRQRVLVLRRDDRPARRASGCRPSPPRCRRGRCRGTRRGRG